MSTSKEIFEASMNALADSVKAKTGTTDTTVTGMKTAVDGITPAKEEETKTLDLSMASGNQVINPTSGKVLTKVTITKPSTLIASNIKKDIVIGGVTGTLESGQSEDTFYSELNSETFGSGYNVTIPVNQNYYVGYSYYAINDDDTWISFPNYSQSPITLNNVTKIKFKITMDSGNPMSVYGKISSTKLGFDITANADMMSSGSDETDWIEVTQNIDDVTVSSGENGVSGPSIVM